MERSLFELKPTTRWIGRRIDIHREVDSTNLVAERLAQRGAPEGLLVLADAQSAGRGRLGRRFFSPPGRSLYLSLLLRPRAAPETLSQYVFAASLAVADTVRAALPTALDVEIKWPNDVLIEGRKTSGLNLPVQLDPRGRATAVLGIGLNVNLEISELPGELRGLATSLRIVSGQTFDRAELAEALLGRLEYQLDRLRGEGFGGVLEGWRKYFRMRGRSVRIGGPGLARAIEGKVRGLDEDGALLVDTDQGRERILAGDVTLLQPEV